MAIIKSYSPFLNLSNYQTFIVDTNPNSDFFRITEFKETFTGGKNGFLIEGSPFLKETTEVKIEILDVEGNPVYFEPGSGTPEYYEGLSTLISVHVYPDTPIGIGKITILGELKEYINQNGTLVPVPEDWKGVYNVKWEKTFKINRNLSNEDSVRFYRRPTVSISELVKPIFSKTIPSITKSGSIEGIALQPSVGSNLTNWTAGTLYKLKITAGDDWTGSVDENIIEVPLLGYYPTVREVLNNKEVLVDTPYSVNNIVQNFTSTPYTTSFEWSEGQTVTDSALTGSFAKMNISNLKTFVGDVARVKVFRKSRNEVTDYQFVQESKLESTELLRDITVSDDTQISYGNFTETNLTNYWVSSSANHPISVNVDVLQSSVKTDYNLALGGVQKLYTSESFSISKDVEYTLTFKTLISGSLNGSEYVKAYFSSSDGYQQTFLTISGSDIYKTRQNVSQNIIASPISSSNAKLVFEISGSDWYISNVSLKNAQETSFSPDEFVLIQDIPRKLTTETFDFKFEFYDINNNYIPVDVFASAPFDGGNDFPTSTKILTLESDRNAFRFITGSHANPHFQQIGFSTTRQNIVGDVTYSWAAYDITGSYIIPSHYTQSNGALLEYPGRPHESSSAGFIVQIDEFSGSLDTESTSSVRVGFITYTASADGLEDYETIYRLEDGDNAPGIFVSSTANQFIYKATNLSINPSGQSITFDVKRKNLGTLNPNVTINSGSEVGNAAGLTFVNTDPTTGVSTYTLAGSIFDYSSGSATYYFTGSDDYGIEYTDTIKITPIKILDGFSVSVTNENTTFPAKSTGEVIGGFTASSGSINVKIGSETISYSSGFSTNTYSASISSYSGLTPTFNGTTYGISALSADSGSLTLLVKYKDGSGAIISSSKDITYSKAKRGTPSVLVSATPQSQVISATSQSVQVGTLQTVALSAIEGTTSVFTSASIFSSNFTGASITGQTLTLGTIGSGINAASASIQVFYTDSESTYTSQSLIVNATKALAGTSGSNGTSGTNGANGVVVSLSPTSQVVKRSTSGTYASPVPFTVQVIENGTPLTHTTGSLTNSTFSFNNISNGTSGSILTTAPTITPTTPASTAGLTTNFAVTYKTSAGVTSTALPQSHSVSVTLDGVTGPGVVHTGIWEAGRAYQYSDGLTDGSGRRDVVLWSTSGTAPYDTYYAATTSHTSTNDTNASTGKPGSGPWVSLGTQDFFVAAKIGIFEESYVQETLNIGTNNNGGVSSANITLRGGTDYPYISIGQSGTVGSQGYGLNGIWIGNDAGSYKASFVNGSTSWLKWNGSSLDIKGSGTFSGTVNASDGVFTGFVSAGTSKFGVGVATGKNGIYINSNNYWYYDTTTNVATFKAGDGTNNMYFESGSLYLTGNLTAGSGSINGATIRGGQLNIGNGVFTVDSSGSLTANSGSFNGNLVSTSGRIGGFVISSGSLSGEYLDISATDPHIILTQLSGSVKVPRVSISNDASLSSGGVAGTPGTATSLTTNYTRVIDTNYTPSAANYLGAILNQEKTGASGSFTAASWAGETATLTFTISPDTSYVSSTITLVTGTANHSVAVNVYFRITSPSGLIYSTTKYYYNSTSTASTGNTLNLTGTDTVSIAIPMENGVWSYTTGISSGTSTCSSNSGTYVQRINTTYTTPDVTGIAIAYTNEFTEINGGGLQVISANNKKVVIPRDSSATYQLQITGQMSATGNIVAYYSDKRLKNIFGNISNPLDKIEKLNGVYYTQSDKAVELGYEPNERMQVGLIAQEVEEVLPEIIHLAPIDTDKDGSSKTGENYLSVDYDKVVPLLVESIKELKKEIEELKRNR